MAFNIFPNLTISNINHDYCLHSSSLETFALFKSWFRSFNQKQRTNYIKSVQSINLFNLEWLTFMICHVSFSGVILLRQFTTGKCESRTSDDRLRNIIHSRSSTYLNIRLQILSSPWAVTCKTVSSNKCNLAMLLRHRNWIFVKINIRCMILVFAKMCSMHF